MQRRNKIRNIGFVPGCTRFAAQGSQGEAGDVTIGLDMIEAMRLVDAENLSQQETFPSRKRQPAWGSPLPLSAAFWGKPGAGPSRPYCPGKTSYSTEETLCLRTNRKTAAPPGREDTDRACVPSVAQAMAADKDTAWVAQPERKRKAWATGMIRAITVVAVTVQTVSTAWVITAADQSFTTTITTIIPALPPAMPQCRKAGAKRRQSAKGQTDRTDRHTRRIILSFAFLYHTNFRNSQYTCLFVIEDTLPACKRDHTIRSKICFLSCQTERCCIRFRKKSNWICSPGFPFRQ